MRRKERERRAAVAAALDREHRELRARLLITVERTESYTADLLAEVEHWQHAREEDPSA